MKGVEPIRDFDKFLELQKKLIQDNMVKECLLLQVMYNTNLRVSDALFIRWDNVMTYDGKARKDFVVSERKTSKWKWIPITDQLGEVLENYYEKYKPRRTNFMFRSLSGRVKRKGNRPWTRVYVYSFLKKYAKKCEIEGRIGAHTPRKTWGYHAYQSGIDIYEVMKILNHSSVKTTETYIGLDDDKIRETYNLMSNKNQAATKLFNLDTLPEESRHMSGKNTKVKPSGKSRRRAGTIAKKGNENIRKIKESNQKQ